MFGLVFLPSRPDDIPTNNGLDRQRFQALYQDRPAFYLSLLGRIAETTGGRYFADGDLSALPGLLRFSSAGVQRMEILPLWNLPILFLLLMLLKLIEWSLRRYWGRI